MNSHLFILWILQHFYWGIWKEHNNRIFREREPLEFIIAEKIECLTLENYVITKGKNIEEGGKYKTRKEDRVKRRQEARWSFPPEDWHKANLDGAAKGNLSLARSGGIIRKNSGGGTTAISFPLGHQINHFAKANVARHIVKLALAFGIEHLWLEGDSLNIINYIEGLTTPS